MFDRLIQTLSRLRVHSAGRGDQGTHSEQAQRTGGTYPDLEIRPPDEIEIVRFIEDNDGVVWQSEITAELDWSASTTSRRLATLEEEERVNRYQVGRRKVVCLPGHEPAYFGGTDRSARAIKPSH